MNASGSSQCVRQASATDGHHSEVVTEEGACIAGSDWREHLFGLFVKTPIKPAGAPKELNVQRTAAGEAAEPGGIERRGILESNRRLRMIGAARQSKFAMSST